MVNIIIYGTHGRIYTFVVHEESICSESAFFASVFNRRSAEGLPHSPVLYDDADVVGLMLHWVYRTNLPFPTPQKP